MEAPVGKSCDIGPNTGVTVISAHSKDQLGSSLEDRAPPSIPTNATTYSDAIDQEEYNAMASNALNQIEKELKTTTDMLHFLNEIMSDLTDIQKKLSERRRLRGLKEKEDAKNNVCIMYSQHKGARARGWGWTTRTVHVKYYD